MIYLGAIVKDRETGYEGVVTARVEYLYFNPQVLVEGIDNTGRPIEHWCAEERVYEIAELKCLLN